MADYGTAVSQKGYDVKTCADRFLVYSSAFQMLKVFSASSISGTMPKDTNATFTANASTDILTSAGHGLDNGDLLNFTTTGTLPGGLNDSEDDLYYVVNKSTNTFKVSKTHGGSAINITSTGSGTHDWWSDISKTDIYHNLGYYSPFFVVYNGNSVAGTTTSYFMSESDETSTLNVRQFTDHLEVRYDSSFDSLSSGNTVYFTVYIFLNDFTTVSQQNINSNTSSGASSSNYGFRISKSGFDVKTCDDIDCVLSSSFYTQIVHRAGIDTSGNVTVTVSHNLGYLPMVFIWRRYTSDDYMVYSYGTQLTTTNVQVVTGGSTNVYYIIFKNKNG